MTVKMQEKFHDACAASYTGISADRLKVIAMITMVIDHIGAVLFPNVLWLRLIGRISFPLYVWLLVMGFLHTSGFKRYMLNMGIFALLSEIPFDLALWGKVGFEGQNIYFALLLSLIMLYFLKHFLEKGEGIANRAGCLAVILAAMSVAGILRFDYGCAGPVLAAVFYLHAYRGRPGFDQGIMIFCMAVFGKSLLRQELSYGSMSLAIAGENMMIELFALGAVPLLNRYNGVRKYKRGKLFFYLFYPAHLLLLYGLSCFKIFS